MGTLFTVGLVTAIAVLGNHNDKRSIIMPSCPCIPGLIFQITMKAPVCRSAMIALGLRSRFSSLAMRRSRDNVDEFLFDTSLTI